MQAQRLQRVDAGQRMAGLQQLDHLVEHARDGHVGQQRHRLGDRRGGLLLEREAQLGHEAHRADDAHRVFAVAGERVADQAQQLLLHVGQAVVVIDHHLALGVVVHRVDGEVAPRGVFHLRAPDVVAQHPAAGVHRMGAAGQCGLAGLLVALDLGGLAVVHVGAEGRHLDHLMVATAAVDHVHDAEAPADDEGAAEQPLHLLGRGIGGHVEVLRPQAHQQVAHRATHHIGLEAGALQGAHHIDGPVVDQLGVDAVRADRHLHPRAGGDAPAGGGGRRGRRGRRSRCSRGPRGGVGRGRRGGALAQQTADEFLDHGNNLRMRQPRCRAIASSAGLGLVATGSLTSSSSGRSLVESL